MLNYSASKLDSNIWCNSDHHNMASSVIVSTNYLLFDLDGTLVFSNQAVEATWKDTIDIHNESHPELPALDLPTFLHTSHGTRTQELFKKFFPYLPNSIDDINDFEGTIVSKYGQYAKEVEGATKLLSKINENHHNQWAIVTSGTKKLAHGWVETVFPNIEKPPIFITANDVNNGKPNPEGYLKGYESLKKINGGKEGVTVVFEDAPTGIKAGVAAGFKVIGMATGFPKQVLIDAGASFVVQDMTSVSLLHDKDDDKIQITLNVL